MSVDPGKRCEICNRLRPIDPKQADKRTVYFCPSHRNSEKRAQLWAQSQIRPERP